MGCGGPWEATAGAPNEALVASAEHGGGGWVPQDGGTPPGGEFGCGKVRVVDSACSNLLKIPPTTYISDLDNTTHNNLGIGLTLAAGVSNAPLGCRPTKAEMAATSMGRLVATMLPWQEED